MAFMSTHYHFQSHTHVDAEMETRCWFTLVHVVPSVSYQQHGIGGESTTCARLWTVYEYVSVSSVSAIRYHFCYGVVFGILQIVMMM